MDVLEECEKRLITHEEGGQDTMRSPTSSSALSHRDHRQQGSALTVSAFSPVLQQQQGSTHTVSAFSPAPQQQLLPQVQQQPQLQAQQSGQAWSLQQQQAGGGLFGRSWQQQQAQPQPQEGLFTLSAARGEDGCMDLGDAEGCCVFECEEEEEEMIGDEAENDQGGQAEREGPVVQEGCMFEGHLVSGRANAQVPAVSEGVRPAADDRGEGEESCMVFSDDDFGAEAGGGAEAEQQGQQQEEQQECTIDFLDADEEDQVISVCVCVFTCVPLFVRLYVCEDRCVCADH